MHFTVISSIAIVGLLGLALGQKSPNPWSSRKWWKSTAELATSEAYGNSTEDLVTTTVKPAPERNLCSCTNEKIWLDIFFLIDGSSAMKFHRMDNAVAHVLSILQKMTIGRDTAKAMKTRVGFIRFASHAHLLYNLSQFESTDDVIYGLEVYYDGSQGGNVKAAIRLAAANFKQPQSRFEVQKVIVIVASAENNAYFKQAEETARKFKENGGSIITIEYSPSDCKATSQLGELASKPSYAFSNCKGPLKAQNIRDAFCDANCFCPKYTKPFEKAAHGCYRAVTMPATQEIAERNCEQHTSIIPKIESPGKANFLTKLMPWNTNFWIGLRRDEGVFAWSDHTELSKRDYQIWAPGYPEESEGDCVYQEHLSSKDIAWKNGDCDNDLDYVCETKPCDTDNYCGILPEEEPTTTHATPTTEMSTTSMPVTSTERTAASIFRTTTSAETMSTPEELATTSEEPTRITEGILWPRSS